MVLVYVVRSHYIGYIKYAPGFLPGQLPVVRGEYITSEKPQTLTTNYSILVETPT